MKEFRIMFQHSNQEPGDTEVGITIWAEDEKQARRTARILLPNGPTDYTNVTWVEEIGR